MSRLWRFLRHAVLQLPDCGCGYRGEHFDHDHLATPTEQVTSWPERSTDEITRRRHR